MEPADGDSAYTERLVRLPGLGVHVDDPDYAPEDVTRAQIDLRETATVYWSAQHVFKYRPAHDGLFAAIAARVPDSQFVFLKGDNEGVTRTFQKRLRATFEAAGLDSQAHCVFLERMSPGRFTAAMKLADVFLDTPGWSGCNTTLESLRHDLPIVTLPLDTMRARHSAAMLQMMGLGSRICTDAAGYVEMAVDLGGDPAARAAYAEEIGRHKHRVYRDGAVIAALEDFLVRVARGHGT